VRQQRNSLRTLLGPRGRVARWLARFNETPQTLACVRIVYAAFALFLLEPGKRFAAVAGLPSGLFLPPPGPARWVADALGLTGFPSLEFFQILDTGLTAALLLLLVGYRTRWVSWGVTLLLLVGSGLFYSSGKINHDLLFSLLPAALAGSGWGNCYSLDTFEGRSEPHRPWLLALVAALLGFAMFSAGVQKLEWLHPARVAAQGHLLRHVAVYGRSDGLGPWALAHVPAAAWKLADIAVVVFEVGFLPAAFALRSVRRWVLLALVFHTWVVLTLNISFWQNYAVYAAFVPWSGVLKLGERRTAWTLPVPSWFVLSALAGALFGLVRYGSPLARLDAKLVLTSDLTSRELLALGLAWLVALASLWRWAPRSRGGEATSDLHHA
jgi:hypothetical protein